MNQIEQNQPSEDSPAEVRSNTWGTVMVLVIIGLLIAGFATGVLPLPL